MKILGITGKSGAGKTDAMSFFESRGAGIINGDLVSRRLMIAGAPVTEQLAEFFGLSILHSDGSVNRKALGALAFSDSAHVRTLNNITHPYILKEIESELEAYRQEGRELAVIEGAALIESGFCENCDKLLVIKADREKALLRIQRRDGLGEEDAARRLDAQKSDEFYEERADFVVENNGSREELFARLEEVYKEVVGQ